MDNQQTPGQPASNTPTQQGATSQGQTPVSVQPPTSVQQPVDATIGQPVSTPGSKETGPVLTIEPSEPGKVIAETAPEVHVSQEVAEAGVTAEKSEVMQISPDLQAQGVQPTGTAVPVPQEPTLKLPMTEEKAKGILRMHKKVKESITWLAMLVIRQMQIFRFNEEKKAKEAKV